MKIDKINNYTNFYCTGSSVDLEEQRIAKRLLAYGIQPTFNKTTDKAKLHEIELREAKKENCVSNKFLTVTTNEQEKIQEKKKEKHKEVNPELYLETQKAQKILGEQIYLAIKMKQKKRLD